VLKADNPESFRSILLIAALHFAWRSGNLGEYERTYLYHKIKCMESVNKHLAEWSRDGNLACMNTIATLCMVEVTTSRSADLGVFWTNPAYNRGAWGIYPKQMSI
jgi:hypothetical protein